MNSSQEISGKYNVHYKTISIPIKRLLSSFGFEYEMDVSRSVVWESYNGKAKYENTPKLSQKELKARRKTFKLCKSI